MKVLNPLNVNAHLHTPYSFSAFGSIPEALDLTLKENVKVAGVNDFYSLDGYAEWNDECLKRKIYPMFNIEFIALQEDLQKTGETVNDPSNPGRTYLSGKGLAHPSILTGKYADMLAAVREESNKQVKAMCEKLNALLQSNNAGFSIDINKTERELTKGNIRERHLAKALRGEAYSFFKNNEAEIKAFFEKIFGKPLKSSVSDVAGVENEIRGNLLKAGGAAFVPEDPKAFLPVDDVKNIILAAGGIPTYPFLADDAKGNFTDFERDIEKTIEKLKQFGIYSVEFITTRNSIEVLEKYSDYLQNKGFVVTFGSEHNTPAMEPIELFARGGVALTPKLKEINYRGACLVAAHQDMFKKGKGYLNAQGIPDVNSMNDYIEYGDNLIKSVVL